MIPRIAALALAAAVLSAAAPSPRVGVAARPADPRTIARADSIYWLGDPAGAIRLLDDYLASDPGSYEARWKAARAAVSLGLLAGDRDEGKRWLERASAHGTEAVRIEADGTDGLYWLIAATGRLSFLQSPRGAAQAAQRVYELAHRLLALDSRHAGAHDALGKLAYRVMRLSGAGRFFGRALFGSEALRTASWERAERHLARAVELDPSWPVVHADLGEAYLHMGRYEEAARELQRALDLPGRHPGDRAYQQKAAEELPFARGRRKP